MLPPGQYSIGWRRQGSEVQIGAEHSWAPWPCRAPPTCLSPPLTCPPTWQTRCPATASARGKLFLGSELKLDELGITYQAIPLLGLTQQQLVFFLQLFFGLPLVLHVERLFEDWLFLTGSSRARGGGGGDAHEEPDEPTRRCPGCPPPPATTQCPPQDLKILSTCFSPLNISFFNYMPIGLCYIHILWNC